MASVDGAIPHTQEPPPDIARNPQSPQAAPRLHIPRFRGISIPHTSGRPPIHKRRLPCQQSPHICAAFPICRRRSPIHFHGFHIQSPSSKNPDIGFDETSARFTQTCASNRFQQITHACEGGWRRHLSRARLHGCARIFTRTSVPWPRLHAHTCTATSTSGHASDETSVRFTQIKRQSSSLKCPEPASHLRGSTRPTSLLKCPGGHGRRRCDVDDDRGGSTCMYDRA